MVYLHAAQTGEASGESEGHDPDTMLPPSDAPENVMDHGQLFMMRNVKTRETEAKSHSFPKSGTESSKPAKLKKLIETIVMESSCAPSGFR